MNIKDYLPGVLRSGRIALTPMRDGELHPNAFRAFTPIRAIQIFGGRRWSLSVIIKEEA